MIKTLKELIQEGERLVPYGGYLFGGYNSEKQPDYISWRIQAMSVIEGLGKPARPLLKELENDENGPYFYQDSAKRVLGVLKGALAIAERQVHPKSGPEAFPVSKNSDHTLTSQVFVVHGHDQVLLHQIARFLEKLEFEPIILFEQAGRGNTIIEKLERYSSTRFAVILLTPDDVGKDAKEPGNPQPRARQNVILELGYFLGKLGRESVAVLYDKSVELPSDYQGVEYIEIDAEGAWKLKLARELKEAGLPIDMNKTI